MCSKSPIGIPIVEKQVQQFEYSKNILLQHYKEYHAHNKNVLKYVILLFIITHGKVRLEHSLHPLCTCNI